MTMRTRHTPSVVLQPETYRALQRGIRTLTDAIRPTLGPRPRWVAIAREAGPRFTPELLDNGALIARRIIALPNRTEAMGAMFLRQVLWRLHEQVGDGTATAAVLFQSVFDQGVRYVNAGGNAMRLRVHLERGLRLILTELNRQVTPLTGRMALIQLAEAISHDPSLAEHLGDVFHTLGEHGQLDIHAGRRRATTHEFLDGLYWPGGLLSRELIRDRLQQRSEIHHAAIVLSDLELGDPQLLADVMQLAARSGAQSLLLVANQLSERALGLLVANQRAGTFNVLAVRTPGLHADDQSAALSDIAAVTGGRPLWKAGGQSLSDLRPADLGRAEGVWANPDFFGLRGPHGDATAQVTMLRAAMTQATEVEQRWKLQTRLGKLTSGAANLWIGGATETEINTRKAVAERTATAVRGAMRHGVLPGGGVALLACRTMIRRAQRQQVEADERAAYTLLLNALAEPTRVILSNAGSEPSPLIAEIERAGPGQGVDARTGQLVNVTQAGILDSASAQIAAVRAAIAGAALALTVEVLVHHRTPDMTLDP
jgi:chaperonin GroEL